MKCEAFYLICNNFDLNEFSTVEPESMDVDPPLKELNTDDLYSDLSVNSLVEVTWPENKLHGIIRWIGSLPDRKERMAGLELVSFMLMLLSD